LQKQSEVLARLAHRHQQHYQAVANRVSTPLSRRTAQGTGRDLGAFAAATKRIQDLPR
jgi:hypothetical protein